MSRHRPKDTERTESGGVPASAAQTTWRRFLARLVPLVAVGLGAALVWVGFAGGVQPYETYEGGVGADGPVAEFRFGDVAGSGVVKDSVGGYSGVNGGVVLGGEGPFGGSGSGLFGGEGFVTLPGDPLEGAGEWTAEAWVDWSGGSSYKQPVFDFGSGSSDYVYLTPASSLSSHKMLVEIHAAGGSLAQVTATKLAANGWHYVAVSETSAGTLTLYEDGEQVGQTTGASVFPSSLGSTLTDYLGRSLVSGEPDFKGSLSNVAFYTKALSASQIKAHWDDAEYPVATVAPSVSGTDRDGDTLTAKDGTWSGLSPITFAYQWTRCDERGESCTDIASATEAKYTASDEDVGSTLRALITASNSAGAGTATTPATAAIEPSPPSNTALPVISGEAKDGQLLSVSNGSWEGTPPLSFTYQWETCASEKCAKISGATGSAYRVITAQIGDTLRVSVTAENAAGHKSVKSAQTATVTAGPPVDVSPPTVSGEAKDGQTLTASTGSWAGTPTITYAYQWQRCNSSGESCTNISSATAATYTLSPADVGLRVRVLVTATNTQGSATSSSQPTAAVAAIPPSNTTPPAISGETKDGQRLTASSGNWNGSPPFSYTYQWMRCENTGEACEPINAATEPSYTLSHADVGLTLRVKVTATNPAGTASTSSPATATITPLPPSNTTPPTLSGEPKDEQTLTANTGQWTGTPTITYTYQWQRCNEKGEACANISGATSPTYLLGHEDVGSTLRVVITATNTAGTGSESSATTSPVAALAPSNTARPSVSGEAKEGQTLTASRGEWAGTPTISYDYQWESCNSLGEGCLDISGATSSSYSIQPTDVGATLRVRVMATNAAGSASAVSEAGAVVAADGTLEYRLEFGSAGSGDGQFDHPADVAVDSAGHVFVLDEGDDRVQEFTGAGEYIRQFGSAGSGEGQLSSPTGLAVDLHGNVWVLDTGNERVEEFNSGGEFVRTIGTGVIGFAEGIAIDAHDDVWVSATYEGRLVVFNDEGEQLKTVGSEGSEPGQFDESEALSIHAGHVWVAEWGNNRVQEFSEAGEYISGFGISGSGAGEIDHPYGIAAGDGHVFVLENGNDRLQEFDENGMFVEQIGSEGTEPGQLRLGFPMGAAVSTGGDLWVTDSENDRVEEWAPPAPPTAPVNTTAPRITGAAERGATLTADPGSWEGTPPLSYSYQWQRCNAESVECRSISGATASEYTLGAEDVGSTLRVQVSASNTAGSASAASPATSIVLGYSAPVNMSAPVISGSTRDGETLTVNPGTWTGRPALLFSYQWEQCEPHGDRCTEITGGGDASYVLQSADIGSTIRVLVSASNAAGSSTVSTAASEEVLAGPPSEQRQPSVEGDPWVGQTLVADPGEWGGTETTTSYQWQRCNSTSSECSDIVGATNSEYNLTVEDLHHIVRVEVGASNALGSVLAISSATPEVNPEAALSSTWAPSISGIPRAGQTLTAEAGSWYGTGLLNYLYEWQRCNTYGQSCTSIEGATSATYVPVGADVGHALRVIMTVSEDDGGAVETSVTTVPIAAADAPANVADPTVTGSPLVGNTLNANTGEWYATLSPTYSYQWERCDESGAECADISGATSREYTASSSDANMTLRVLVSVEDAEGHVTSAPSELILISGEALRDISSPSVSGTEEVGRALAGTAGLWTGAGPIAYGLQWERCSEAGESCAPLGGMTEEDYVPTAEDNGHALRLHVEAKGTSESGGGLSAPTHPISDHPIAPEDKTPPSLEGYATEGDILTAQTGTWLSTEAITYSYQWQRCDEEGEDCTNIEDAAASTYTLGEADLSSTVRVLVTGANSLGSATSDSEVSEAVQAPGPPSNIEAPTILGPAMEGAHLVAQNGTWSGSRPLAFLYQWQRCNSEGAACSSIEGATGPSYVPVSGDIGSRLRLVVTAKNDLATVPVAAAATDTVVGSESTNTTQAVEIAEASDPSSLAKAETATLEEQTVTPAVTDAGEELHASNTLTEVDVSKDTPGELALSTPEGEISFTPLGAAPGASTMPTVANETAAVFAGIFNSTDTIVRPGPMGATTLMQLRSSQAPTSFSWEVGLGAGQELQELANGSIAVVTPSISLAGPITTELEAGTESESGEAGKEYGETEAGEALEGTIGEGTLEKLSAAPTVTTAPFTPGPDELHPQDTATEYEEDNATLTYAEAHAAGSVLMVIQAPEVRDAEGHVIPAKLSTNGGTTVTLDITPEGKPAYPITASEKVTAPTKTATEASQHSPTYGLGDAKASVFEELDPKLKSGPGPLHASYARDVIAYTTGEHPAKFNELVQWLKAVGHDGLKPYLTLGSVDTEHEFCNAGEPCDEPTTSQYKKALAKLLERLNERQASERRHNEEVKAAKAGTEEDVIPNVYLWGAWNEPDLNLNKRKGRDPLYKDAARAAEFWEIAQSVIRCGSCRVVAGEFAEDSEKEHIDYIETYLKHILYDRYQHSGKARNVGFHDYQDIVNVPKSLSHYTNPAARRFAAIVKHRFGGHAHILFSEQGVELQYGYGATRLAQSQAPKEYKSRQLRAAEDFMKLADGLPNVDVVNYYEYLGPDAAQITKNPHIFDSALLDGAEASPNNLRPAYCYLVLDKHGCPARAVTIGHVEDYVLGTVEPNGLPTRFWVEWSPPNSPHEHTVTSAVELGEAEGTQSVQVELDNLIYCSTYKVRVIAENEANEGTPSDGVWQTITTKCAS